MSRKLSLLSIVAALVFTGAGCISFGSSTATTGPMGVFRSNDKGDTWQAANAVPTPKGVASIAGVKVYKLFTDPSDPKAIYLGSRGQGMFYSYDQGDSWTKATQLGDRFIYAVSVDPTDKCTIYVTDGGGIFKTDDCSRTWKTVYTDLNNRGIRSISLSPDASRTIYASLMSGSIIRSTDAGASWKSIKTFNQNIQYVVADPQTPGRVYVAGVDSGLVRSDDSGATWKSLTSGLQNFSDSLYFYRLVLHPKDKNTLYWLSKYGILVSKDAGETWSDLKLLSPPGSVNIYAFGVNPENSKEMYYVGTILGEEGASRSTFYKSVDGGNNWVTKKLPTNTVPVTLLINPTDTKVLTMGFTIPDVKK